VFVELAGAGTVVVTGKAEKSFTVESAEVGPGIGKNMSGPQDVAVCVAARPRVRRTDEPLKAELPVTKGRGR
jgi:hypothetical protein